MTEVISIKCMPLFLVLHAVSICILPSKASDNSHTISIDGVFSSKRFEKIREIRGWTGKELSANLDENIHFNARSTTKTSEIFISKHTRQKRNTSKFNRENITDIFNENPCFNPNECKVDKNRRNCFCDSTCSLYNDCCENVPVSQTTSVNVSLRMLSLFNNTECITPKFMIPTYYGYQIVTKCPKSFTDDTIVNNCKNPAGFPNIVPVFDNDGIAYVNAFCAYCNGIQSFTFWRLAVTNCFEPDNIDTDDIEITEKIKNPRCRSFLALPPPAIFTPRLCIEHIDYTNPTNKAKCEKYFSPVLISTTPGMFDIYRNFFCSPSDIKLIEYQCYFELENEIKFTFNSITVLFDVTSMIQIGEKKLCSKEQRLDEKTGTCVQKCTNDCGKTIVNYYFDRHFVFVMTGNVDLEFVSRNLLWLFICLPVPYYGINMVADYIYKQNCTTSDGEILTFLNYQVYLTLTKELLYGDIMRLISDVDAMKFTLSVKSQKDSILQTSQLMAIFNGSIDTYDPKNESTQCASGTDQWTRSLFTKDLHHIKTRNINSLLRSHNMYKRKGVNQISFEKTICRNRKIEIAVVPNHDGHEVLQWTCEDKMTNNIVKTDKSAIATILSNVVLCISSLSLMCTIFIYKTLRLDENTPGKMTLHLMVAMVLASVSFVAGVGANDHQLVCSITGIFLHYFWLSSFTWMSLCIFHVAFVFRRLQKEPNYNTSGVWKGKYLVCIAYCIPLLVVVPSVAIEFCNCTQYSIGYAGKVCFPSQFPAVLFCVTAPIVSLLLVNVVSLVNAIYSIHVLKSHITTHVNKDAYENFLVIYGKLSVLSGVVWIMIFIPYLGNFEISNILINLICGSHGFLVSLCFIGNKRVIRMLGLKYGCIS